MAEGQAPPGSRGYLRATHPARAPAMVRVVAPDDAAVEGATVVAGGSMARLDRGGEFVERSPVRLEAVEPGVHRTDALRPGSDCVFAASASGRTVTVLERLKVGLDTRAGP